MEQLIHTTLSHYQFERRLARGGMADIYIARDLHNDTKVAIKLVHQSVSNYCERFQREAEIMARLQHPHILPVLEYGQWNSWYYLITPYIEDGTLHDQLKKGIFTLERAAQVLEQLASALQYAHDQGVVHRDIKPSNVLMYKGQHIYLADFGLVKCVGETHDLTLSSYLIGTPEYMAPELIDKEATVSSDIYALGVVLYQMITGHVPFRGSTPVQTFMKHLHETPRAPSLYNPLIPESVDRVILYALSKQPDLRYRSVRDFVEAYYKALDDWYYICVETDTLTALPAVSTSSQTDRFAKQEEVEEQEQKSKDRIAISWVRHLAVVAVLLVALGTVGGVLSNVLITFATSPIPDRAPVQNVKDDIPRTPTIQPKPTEDDKQIEDNKNSAQQSDQEKKDDQIATQDQNSSEVIPDQSVSDFDPGKPDKPGKSKKHQKQDSKHLESEKPDQHPSNNGKGKSEKKS